MNIPVLHDKNVLLGVTGSIAAYKAASLASKLTQAGALVDVILTDAGCEFVSPLTFQSVTGRRAYRDEDMWGSEGHVLHIGLGQAADIFVVAPATANTIAKMAHGQADNLLSVTALAARCQIVIAPAMDGGMFAHPATQENLKKLMDRGVLIVGPAEGHLASGMTGIGRMVEPDELFGNIRTVLAKDGQLKDRKILVTAGGTQEPIDPVRVISNRSSGKQGFALAQAALDLGADVTLITAPTHLDTPFGAHRVDVNTAEEMGVAVGDTLPDSDVLIMAAAVADFRPKQTKEQKIKKKEGAPTIELETTDDILSEVATIRAKSGYPQVVVGFAAETKELLDNARAKLKSKNLDLICANDIFDSDAGFEVDTNRITMIFSDGRVESLELMTKSETARTIMEKVTELLVS